MKYLKIISLSLMLVILSGCLSFDFWEVRILFNDDSNHKGKITVTYSGLASDSDSLKKQESDFNEIIESYHDDEFLMDQVKEGIYVKDRQLYEQDGKLIFTFNGIFDGFEPGPDIELINNEYVLEFTDKDMVLTKTNGLAEENEDGFIIKWPVTQKELYFKIENNNKGKRISLLPFYKKWIKQSGARKN